MNNSKTEKIFQISAVISIGVAAYFLWRGNNDGLFVAGVVGAVSFFLSIRFQVKERMEQRKLEEWEDEEKLGEDAEIREKLEPDSRATDFSAQEIIDNQSVTDNRKSNSDNRL